MLFCQLLHGDRHMLSMVAVNCVLALCKTFIIDHARDFLAASLLCWISCLSGCAILKRRIDCQWKRIDIGLGLIAIAIFRNRKRRVCIEGVPRCSRCWSLDSCQLNGDLLWKCHICDRCHVVWLIWHIFQICRALVHARYKGDCFRILCGLKRKLLKRSIGYIVEDDGMTRIFLFKANR